MLNSKYSKVLTIILILAIIGIVALLIFVGIDWYKAYTTDNDADDFLGQFNDYIGNIQQPTNTEIQNNTQTNNINEIDPIIDVNNVVAPPSNNTTNGGNSSNKLTYKGYNVVGRIQIPKTKADYPLLDKVTPKSIETSIGVLYGPGVNKVGNTVLVGHNYKNGTFFSNNKKLVNGDKIYITDMEGKKVTYTIYKKYTTSSEDATYFTRDTKGKREISLSTCTDNDNNYRLVIWAKED